jgi:hypothetical protein
VKGKVVDAIEKLGIVPRYIRATPVWSFSLDNVARVEKLREWLYDCRTIATGGTDTFTAQKWEEFWQAMTCSLTGEGLPAPHDYSKYFSSYLKFMSEFPEKFREMVVGVTLELQDYVDSFQSFKHNHDLETYRLVEDSLEKWASKRRFCTTENSRLGCVPTAAKEGDIICVLYGSEVPYILRRIEGGGYMVVGECYINGIMHGEALSDVRFRTEEFRLQ